MNRSIKGSDRIVVSFILYIGITGPVLGMIPSMKKTAYLWIPLLATVSMLLLACSDNALKPAPVGEYTVLEELASAYRATSEQYPMQPQAMPPEGRRDFLTQVFMQAGYSYSATLLALADAEVVMTNQDHRDLVDLLLLPGKGISDTELATIYSADELAVVRRLRADFH